MEIKQTELIEALNLETIELQYETLNINGVEITYGYPSDSTRDYINRVYRQSKSQPYLESSDNRSDFLVQGIRDNGELVQRLSDIQIEYEYLYATDSIRQVQDNKFYFSPSRFLHADISGPEDRKTVLSIGDIPHIGISCLIRKILFSEYLKLYPDLIVFHSNAIVDQRTNSCFIFSGEEVDGVKGKKGKTTMTLSTVIQLNSPFAYLANDDLILTSSSDGVGWLPFPAEINVGEKTMQRIQTDGYNLRTEKEEYEFSGEKHYMLTAGAIEDSGFNIASGFRDIKYWFVMDLNAATTDYSITNIDPEKIETEILKTIKKSRMGQLYLPDVLGEQESALGTQYINTRIDAIELNARKIIKQLKQSGTKFLMIKGGLDRDKLNDMLRKFTEPEQ